MDSLTFWLLAATIPLWVPAALVLGGLATLFLVFVWAGIVGVLRGPKTGLPRRPTDCI